MGQDELKDTKEFWQNKLGAEISDLEAAEILANLLGFFEILAEWEKTAYDSTGSSTENSRETA